MTKKDLPVIILGSGGHAGVVVETLKKLNANIFGIVSLDSEYEELFGIKILGGDEEILKFSKEDLAKLPSEGKGNADNKKPIMAQKRVFENVGKRGVFWKGAYTGKKILHSSKVDVDHVVPKFRAQASEFMGNKMLETLKQKYKFVRDTKNLVISTQHENREVKKGYGLSKYQPPLKSTRPAYAQKYSDVMQDYGMKMSIGEAAKYTEMTGKTLSHERKAHGLWDQEESNRMNTFMETERAKSMRSRNK